MKQTFIDSLDEESARLLRAALNEGEAVTETPDELGEMERRAGELAREIQSNVGVNDAITFGQELTAYLDAVRARTLQAQELQDEISSKRSQIDEARFEIIQLSAGRAALAEAVNETANRYEEARFEYGKNEFSIGTAEELVVQRRSEIAALRRQLAELTKNQEVNQ